MMGNEDLILQTLREIREDQKSIGEQLKMITRAQNHLESDLRTIKNGYEPHEIVEFLHWIEGQKEREENRFKDIQRTIIAWVIPILLAAAVAGLIKG